MHNGDGDPDGRGRCQPLRRRRLAMAGVGAGNHSGETARGGWGSGRRLDDEVSRCGDRGLVVVVWDVRVGMSTRAR
ncbi:leucine-rich repeat extensin-like protein 3 [Iris pallida]|uniref:Leucine-rich repeat extensin-like protein 3 n=1 Tax=Iris pallida TaxID=29817 RepID=A0AAX6H739_IRIPA|nr:leucine-rich repeat extensin-like protein 3 [Iris pallida]